MKRLHLSSILASKRPSELKVGEVMTPDPLTLGPGDRLSEAWAMMEQRRFMHIPIVKDGKLVGRLTERHVRDAMPSILLLTDPASRLKALEVTRVHQVWIPEPRTASPSDDLRSAIRTMRTVKAGSLPVVDGDRLIGILTAGDLLSLLEALLALQR